MKIIKEQKFKTPLTSNATITVEDGNGNAYSTMQVPQGEAWTFDGVRWEEHEKELHIVLTGLTKTKDGNH